MKTFKKVFLFAALSMLIGCDEKVETKMVEVKQSSFEVIAMHDIEVKADTDLTEFESFVKENIAPIYNNMEGQYFTLVKGDRGVRTNKYTVVLTFDSVDDRNRIYPPSGEFVGDFGPDEIWEAFDAMLDKGIGEGHTDYVRVGE
ncbi:MAG: hypothetical protein KJN65_04745 [Croceitalea sp.]|nr:hypothetical protein [Croceitalea sp.]